MAEGGSKLSEEQIYESLKCINVPVRLNDLKVPTREFIVRVFECFIKDLQIDLIGLRIWETTSHIEDPEIYEESQYLVLLAMSVNHIINPCGLNITIKDIVEPKPKRTKKILNYLLVFWKFYLQKYAHFRAVEESFESERKQAEDLNYENQFLDEKCNNMSNLLKSMQPSKDELLNSVIAKKEKESTLESRCQVLISDYQLLKTDEANLRSQIDAANVNIVTAKESLKELSQLILSSPERITAEIQRLKDAVKAEDVKIKEKENKLRDREKDLKMQEEGLKNIDKAVVIVKNLDVEVQHLSDMVKSVIAAEQKLESERGKVKNLQIELDKKQEKILQIHQQSAKVDLNTKKQKETFLKVLETCQIEEEKEKKALEFVKAAINSLQENIDAESDRILEIMKLGKEASSKTKIRKSQYFSRLEETNKEFKADCDALADLVKTKFPL